MKKQSFNKEYGIQEGKFALLITSPSLSQIKILQCVTACDKLTMKLRQHDSVLEMLI